MSEIDDLRAERAKLEAQWRPLFERSVAINAKIDELIVEAQGGWFLRRYYYYGQLETDQFATLEEARLNEDYDFDGDPKDIIGPDGTIYNIYTGEVTVRVAATE